jgi:Ala-tRNA(Pro) deacylase
MPLTRLKQYLDDHAVAYSIIPHAHAFSAEVTAKTAHVPVREMAKTVMIIVDGRMAMAVLPASFHVDFGLLKDALGCEKVELAVEEEFEDLFPGCEVGAMPPFGNLYDVSVYVAHSLTEDENIAFNAGNHTELIQMKYADFARLVHPTTLHFTTERV